MEYGMNIFIKIKDGLTALCNVAWRSKGKILALIIVLLIAQGAHRM